MCLLHTITSSGWSHSSLCLFTLIVCVLYVPVITLLGKSTRRQETSRPPVSLLSPCRKLPLKEENGKESLKPDTIEIKVHSDNSIHTKPDDSKA